MRKILFLLGFMLCANWIFAQPNITLGIHDALDNDYAIDVSNLTAGQKVYISLSVDAIDANSEIWGMGLFFNVPAGYLSWDGTGVNPMPGVTYVNPLFPPVVLPANVAANWYLHSNGLVNVFGFLWGDGGSFASLTGQTFPVTIITLKFTYLGGVAPGQTIPIYWSTEADDSGGNGQKVGGVAEVYYNDFFEPFNHTYNDASMYFTAYDVTFTVTDNQTALPIEGATVTVGSESLITDASGHVVFQRGNGNYSYTVTKTGYLNKTGNFTVAGAPTAVNVAMNQVGAEFDVTFHVTDGTNDLQGALITVGSETATTDAGGLAVIGLADGNYNYTVSKYGYADANGAFTVAGAAQTIDVALTMLPHYNITFHVTADGSGLEGATVALDGIETLTTDINGDAVFSLVDGAVNYTVSKAGYYSSTGSYTVAGADATVPVDLTIIPTFYDVTFHVTSGGADVEFASVTVGTETLFTDASGIAVFSLNDGNYDYLVTLAGYNDASGSFDVNGAAVNVPVELTAITYPVTFHATSGGTNLAGVTITIGSQSLVTNASGIAVFNLPDGFYEYDAIMPGYISIIGESFLVSGGPVNIEVPMIGIYYEITFHVTSGGAPLQGVAVTVNGSTLISPPSGDVLFYLQNGTYPYTAVLAGYNTVNANVTVSGANQVVPVDMVITTYAVTFHVVDDNNANLEGASVIILGQTVTTNAAGIAVFNLPNGTYSYVVSKTGYSTESGSVTVLNAPPATIEEMLTFITYTVTFHAVGAGGALEGVSVLCEGQTVITNIQGNATLDLPPGTYTYEASKPGYVTVTGDFTIIAANVTENIIMVAQTWAVTFVVTNNGNPVEGAVVALQGSPNQTTGEDGTTVFQKANGTYTWTVTHDVFGSEDGTVIVNNAAQTVNVILVGVNDISASSFSIYPNPSTGVFSLTTSAVMGYESNITVYDLAGKLVYTGKLEGNEVNVIDLSAQEKGMYIMQIIVEDNVYNKTLIIQ